MSNLDPAPLRGPPPTGGNRLWLWTRPESVGGVLGVHLPFAVVAGLVLLVSFFIPYKPPLFRTCGFLLVTGYPCAFCGYTRTFAGVSAGDWAYAWTNSPMAFVLYVIFALVLAWNLAAGVFRVRLRPGPMLHFITRHPRRSTTVFVVLVLVNWGYRLAQGMT